MTDEAGHRAEHSNCSSCGARLVWAHNGKTGRPGPITAEPKDNGNVLLYRAYPSGLPSYAVLPPVFAGLLRKMDVPLRLNHFADCPNAEQHRPPRQTEGVEG